MAIKTILKMGDPRLLTISAEVKEFNTPALDQLVEDMFDTMAAYSGVGLAAPQIGEMQRVVIFGASPNERYPDIEEIPQTLIINPVIKQLTTDVDGMWEGCLSVPNMRGYVERPNHIHYSGYDIMGNYFEKEAKGFEAIVVQHECDHLDGKLYPMQIKDMRLFGFMDELDAAIDANTDVDTNADNKT